MKARDSIMTFAFTGGGTGGHIYPGLAVASCLQKKIPCRIIWIGSAKGMDRSIVEAAGLEFYGIASGKLRRRFSLRNVTDLFRVIAGFFAARKILKKERPKLLFSKGGFVSVPPSAAAASLKIPVYGHESDLTPGLATRINFRFSEKLFIPYKDSVTFYAQAVRNKLDVSGNPVRPLFQNADGAKGRVFLGIEESETMLLVLGGSSGSLEINNLIAECLIDLVKEFIVVHQCGSGDKNLPAGNARYKPYEYINDELPHVIAAADLVICRGGAGTLWECAALKKPMIIIPLRGTGTRGDQVENARIFHEAGAAINFINDINEEISAKKLAAMAAALAADKEKLKAMASSQICTAGAADYIAEAIMQKVRGDG